MADDDNENEAEYQAEQDKLSRLIDRAVLLALMKLREYNKDHAARGWKPIPFNMKEIIREMRALYSAVLGANKPFETVPDSFLRRFVRETLLELKRHGLIEGELVEVVETRQEWRYDLVAPEDTLVEDLERLLAQKRAATPPQP